MRILPFILLLSVLAAKVDAQVPGSHQSPAEARITFAQSQIAKHPDKFNLYTELATALLRRERETSDKSFFDQAQTAIDKSLKLSPANLEAEKVEAAILLGQHDFQGALILAQGINSKDPDDVMTYGYITDADIALGDYAGAEKAAQWMLDLRTHNVPGLIRGAELRRIFGDTDGALQFLNDVYQETSPDQSEDIAWVLTRMAEIQISVGRLDLADQLLQKSLTSFPEYYYSLEVQAQVRSAQHKFQEAADLLHQRNQQFPQLESLYAEAQAVEQTGNLEKAKTLYADFAQKATAEINQPDNDNRDLVLYYLAHNRNLAEALRIARLEASKRHDVWTLDPYAMALYANGKPQEAEVQVDKALASGIRDANIFYHAAEISAAMKNQTQTVGYLQSSLAVNPNSEVGASARDMLAKFGAPEYGKQLITQRNFLHRKLHDHQKLKFRDRSSVSGRC